MNKEDFDVIFVNYIIESLINLYPREIVYSKNLLELGASKEESINIIKGIAEIFDINNIRADKIYDNNLIEISAIIFNAII